MKSTDTDEADALAWAMLAELTGCGDVARALATGFSRSAPADGAGAGAAERPPGRRTSGADSPTAEGDEQ
ncbi:hypothetical protein ACFVYF_19255 [Streptomyces sp. NPDC058274]|uniref:hypothetical protein n=1 Tax=Streptomyces sp. NPDC058274 TaxID=3346416 RepID=UPI0036E2A983